MATAIEHRKRINNFLLVWLDSNIDSNSLDMNYSLQKLRTVINDVVTFTEPKECMEFLQSIKEERLFLVTSGFLGQSLIPTIHELANLDTIYVFCANRRKHERWIREWSKINDVFTDIDSICIALRAALDRTNRDDVPLKFIISDGRNSRDENLNRLEPSFMYTQLLKDTILEIEYSEQEKKRLIGLCRTQYEGNSSELRIVDEFDREYTSDKAVWWYTRECFIYHMLNRALRLLEGSIIVDMGFFIRDLHRQLENFHREQLSQYGDEPFTIYRGQGLSVANFEKLNQTKGGLLGFNCFLSTSTDRRTSLSYAESAAGSPGTIGILFEIIIDPKLRSTPFANISEISYFKNEAEILFSMHSIFRIGNIQSLSSRHQLFEVQISLSEIEDPELSELKIHFDQTVTGSGWGGMAYLLNKIGQTEKAEDLYLTLLENASEEHEQAVCYHQLGYIKDQQGDYAKAIEYYQGAIVIYEKIPDSNQSDLATSYNNIGLVYRNMGDYVQSLNYYEKALDIRKKILDENHPSLANSYNNIGLVYDNMGDYKKALSHYDRALLIRKKILPEKHPDLAQSYNNIGLAYDNLKQYSYALAFYEKALDIREKTLPDNHPDLAQSYNNIGALFNATGDYSKAFSYLQKFLDINKKHLSNDHPDLGHAYNNMGTVYQGMKDYTNAIENYEKALSIWNKVLPENHPFLAGCYYNMAWAYRNLNEHTKALPFFEKSLAMFEISYPADHPNLVTARQEIENFKQQTG